MRSVFVLSALAMAACTAQPGRADVPPAAQTIEGRFIVTTVDGREPVINIKGYEPTVTIGAGRIHFQSQCIYADWTYVQHAGQVSTKTYFEPGSGMCARGLAPGEIAIEDAFSKATAIEPAASGGLTVLGGGHRLELRRAP